MSRLARSCRDWHQLLEICALSDTLRGDAEGIYCANDFNDRLLLGLKGTMSEAELHILKARMLQGRRAKAQRGELRFHLPRGYVLNRTGEIVLDDDEQVQWRPFAWCSIRSSAPHVQGSAAVVCRPGNPTAMPGNAVLAKGELEWHRPNRAPRCRRCCTTRCTPALIPMDGGPATTLPRRPGGPPRAARCLIKGWLPAYISWETYERNLAGRWQQT